MIAPYIASTARIFGAVPFALVALLFGLPAAHAVEEYQDCPTCPVMVKMDSGPDFAKFAVTRDQFAEFAATQDPYEKGCFRWRDTGWFRDEEATWDQPGFEQTGDHPVVCVSWLDATAYAEWLSEKTGQLYRLPSVEESIAAASAGATTKYIWGDDADGACLYANVGDQSLKGPYPQAKQYIGCDDGYVHTAPVGSFKPNALGLYDVYGNSWEWTNSCLKGDCANAIFRGGAWNDIWQNQFEVGYSFGDRIVVRSGGLGFRVVRD
ncbi:formylglycine-generating enzyme family protein [Jiella marina]|uniref:formylglycine-generating enzyme family protein n=1 Tax=Jiella sp. LLJ827 TaxID=2917712 RepID=UPI002101ADFD|nr:SUMF1/EgtB/PvdO family nonheme iron enzyme [Jiella sp. LLJ827]MCQ0986588.1 formylglycine-generating enzyme family protein [Jiella sp. LLJ827]